MLIAVDAQSLTWLDVDKPGPIVFYEVVKGMITGDTPDVAEVRHARAGAL